MHKILALTLWASLVLEACGGGNQSSGDAGGTAGTLGGAATTGTPDTPSGGGAASSGGAASTLAGSAGTATSTSARGGDTAAGTGAGALGGATTSGVSGGGGASNRVTGGSGPFATGGAVTNGGSATSVGASNAGGITSAGGSLSSSTAHAGGISNAGGSMNSGGVAQTGGARTSAGVGGTSTAPKVTISIHFTGPGKGEVGDSSDSHLWGGALCSQDCVLTYTKQPSTSTFKKVLIAHPINGSDSYFAGFSGDCTGLESCSFALDQNREITVEFRAQTYNFAFISSSGPENTVSDITDYDKECNSLATQAGVNTAAGDAYVAWVSDTQSAAIDRLGTTARGFVLIDQRPVADTIASLLAGQMYYPIRVDDRFRVLGNDEVRTGTLGDGTPSTDNCWGWNSDSDGYYLTVGYTAGGPVAWTDFGTLNCLNPPRIYCFGTTFSKELLVEKTPGKLIYLSEPYTPGNGTPDQACAASAPANAGPVIAIVTYDDIAASSLLDPDTLYVRPDGMPVGTGAEIVTASNPVYGTDPSDKYLRTGIWQAGDGSYPIDDADPAVWVGDSVMTRASLGGCGNWTSPSSSSFTRVGSYHLSSPQFWNLESSRRCSMALRLYCIES